MSYLRIVSDLKYGGFQSPATTGGFDEFMEEFASAVEGGVDNDDNGIISTHETFSDEEDNIDSGIVPVESNEILGGDENGVFKKIDKLAEELL